MVLALATENHIHPHDHKHDHNCATCHDHSKKETNPKISSATKLIHKTNGHQCSDSSCKIEAPHGHNKLPNLKLKNKPKAINLVHSKKSHHKHKHVHGEKCNHDHKHEHKHEHHHDHKHEHKHEHHHDHKFPLWPLEDFIAHTKLPKWLRESALNASFLSPAMITTELLEKIPMPKLFKTWFSITAMHAMNRGKQKLPRLGLTYLISGAASAGSNTVLGAKLSRFLATSAVAFVEKFSSNGHHHDPETLEQMIKREIGTLFKNIGNAKQWKELMPSLFNIEAKVQLIAPLINTAIEKSTQNLDENTKTIINTGAKIIFTSLGFVGLDQILQSFAKSLFGENSAFAASISSVCGCCGSPVCSAAATDAALSNSM